MDKKRFKELLNKAKLSQKELAETLNTSNQTVNNWGSNGREIPYWVESWLENYIKAKDMDKVVEAVRPYVVEER